MFCCMHSVQLVMNTNATMIQFVVQNIQVYHYTHNSYCAIVVLHHELINIYVRNIYIISLRTVFGDVMNEYIYYLFNYTLNTFY